MKLINNFIYGYIDLIVINPLKNKKIYFHEFIHQYEKRRKSGILYFISLRDDSIPLEWFDESPIKILKQLEERVQYKTYNSGYNQSMDCILLTLLRGNYPEYIIDYSKLKNNSVGNPIDENVKEEVIWKDSDSKGIYSKIEKLRNNINFWDV